VGISDSGERALYLTNAAMCTMGNRGVNAISVTELQQRFPGQYDGLTLAPTECIVNIANAGMIWETRIGQLYGYKPNVRTAVQTVDIPEIQAHIIVADSEIDAFIQGTLTTEIHIYCTDKEAMKTFLAQKTELETGNYIRVSVADPYAEKYAEYSEAAHLRADARTIVTVTVLVLCLVMLYLLCRAQVQERLGLVAVYRLLGIPKRKLHGIFLTESLLSALGTVIPSTLLTWVGVALLTKDADSQLNLILPWEAAALLAGIIILYYALVSLLPLLSLLRLPPARLAAKYDV
jgi:ABC-type lipoprotein release transport system permease subunit